MGKDLNQCNFIGRLGKDVELKYTAGGSAIANFSIACGDDYKTKEGEKVEKTNWINIVIFGKLAEIAGEYLKKGSQVYISGKQVTRKWQDQSGQDRYSTEVVVDSFSGQMQMLNGREAGASRPQQGGIGMPQNAPAHSEQAMNGGDFEDDIPFAKVDWREW